MQLDLNLLTALDALLEEQSVTAAADRLYLSAPAMSRTLGRIRRATGDQILVRTGRTMTPTPYALDVRERVHALVAQAHAVLAPLHELDLQTLRRDFTLQCHDALTSALAPALLLSVQAEAPGVRLRLLAEAPVDTSELRHGHVDLQAGDAEPTAPELTFDVIGADRLVVAMREDHPLATRRLTARRYADAAHVTVSRRGRLRDPIDDALDALGLRRSVVAAAPTTTIALQIVASTDIVTVVPERICRRTASALGLRTTPMPLALPDAPIVLAWHHRYDDDRAHRWLRAHVTTALVNAMHDVAPVPRSAG